MSTMSCNDFLKQLEQWMEGERSVGRSSAPARLPALPRLVEDLGRHPSNGRARWTIAERTLPRRAYGFRCERSSSRKA